MKSHSERPGGKRLGDRLLAKLKLAQGSVTGPGIEKVRDADRRVKCLAPESISPNLSQEERSPLVDAHFVNVPGIASVPFERDLVGNPWHCDEKGTAWAQAAPAGVQKGRRLRQVFEDIRTSDDIERLGGKVERRTIRNPELYALIAVAPAGVAHEPGVRIDSDDRRGAGTREKGCAVASTAAGIQNAPSSNPLCEESVDRSMGEEEIRFDSRPHALTVKWKSGRQPACDRRHFRSNSLQIEIHMPNIASCQ